MHRLCFMGHISWFTVHKIGCMIYRTCWRGHKTYTVSHRAYYMIHIIGSRGHRTSCTRYKIFFMALKNCSASHTSCFIVIEYVLCAIANKASMNAKTWRVEHVPWSIPSGHSTCSMCHKTSFVGTCSKAHRTYWIAYKKIFCNPTKVLYGAFSNTCRLLD